MIRHVFIAPVKNGVPAELLEARIAQMRGLATAVDGIEGFALGRNLALLAPLDAVVMVVDLADRAAFDALIASPLHQEISASAAEAFDVEHFSITQVEI